MSTAREYLRLTPEAVPGTFDGSTVGVAGQVIIDVDNAQSYTVRKTPITQTIRTAGAFNRRLTTFSKKFSVNGNLTWMVRGSQAALLAAWCVPTANILKSYTIDHALVEEDSGLTHIYSRHLGMYVGQAQFTASESDQWFKAALSLVGMNVATITAADFSEPAVTDYPTDAFLTFENASAGLTLHAVQRADLDSFSCTIKNILDTKYFVAANPQKIKWCGDEIDFVAKISYSVNVPRTDFEAVTGIAAAITFDNSTHTLVFNMHANNVYKTVNDSLDMSKVFVQEVTLENHLDTSAATAFSLTAT